MNLNIELIVLNYTKFGENSIALHTLSREYGRRSFMVRIGKNTPMAMFLPLNIIEADIVENPKSSFMAAKNFKARSSLIGIRNNIYKNSMTLFMSEVLYRTIKDGSNEEGLFDWCAKSILTLDAISSDFSNFHIRFLLELAAALGFSPSIEDIKPFCKHNELLVRSFLVESLSNSMLIPLKGEERNEICENLLRYLEFHTESSINVQSLKVLRELYKD